MFIDKGFFFNKWIKKNIFQILFSIFLFLFLPSASQQIPLHNQYIYNPLIINPAFAGVSSNSTVSLTNKSQWIGFSEGINTISLSGNYMLDDNQGIGATLFQDNTGSIKITGFEIDYSFKIPFVYDYNISFGLGLVPYQFLYDATQNILSNGTFNINEQSDPTLINSEKKTSFDANLGIFIYNEFLYAGFSALNLIQSSTVPSLDDSKPNQLVRHFYAILGYNYFNSSSKYGIEQNILMRNSQFTGPQFDFNIKGSFNELFWLNLGYRTSNEILVGFGIKYDRFGFIYNIDINNGQIGNLSNSSHEFGLVFQINKTSKNFNWARDINLLLK